MIVRQVQGIKVQGMDHQQEVACLKRDIKDSLQAADHTASTKKKVRMVWFMKDHQMEAEEELMMHTP